MANAPAASQHRPLPSRRTLRLQAQQAEEAQQVSDARDSARASITRETDRPIQSLPQVSMPLPRLTNLGSLGSHQVATAAPAHRTTKWLQAVAAVGTAGLVLTAALPGVTVITDETAPASVGTQHLLLGALADPDIDAIGAVATEEIGMPTSDGLLVNYPEAPVQYPVTSGVQLTDGFAYRTAPIAQFHNAQDFAAPEGTPVMAMADGKVSHVGYTDDGLGYNVEIEHEIDGQSVTSRYAHMQFDSSPVAEGTTVAVGDHIGNVGNTGFSFGAHLHLVIKVEGEAVDPMIFIPQYNRAAPLSDSNEPE